MVKILAFYDAPFRRTEFNTSLIGRGKKVQDKKYKSIEYKANKRVMQASIKMTLFLNMRHFFTNKYFL
jgi:hypothetical protein